MKKTLILLSALAIIACKKEVPIDYAIVSGKITNKEKGDFTFNSMDRTINDPIEVLEDGSFSDTLRVKEGNYVLYDGTNPIFIYIENGNNLVVNYDAKDFENSLAITGQGSEISNYLLKKRKLEKTFNIGPSLYKEDESGYKATLTALKTAQEDELNATQKISEDFKAKERRNLNYFTLGMLTRYESAHGYYAKKQGFKASEEFMNDLNDLDYNNEEDFLFSREYKSLVSNHYRKAASDLEKKDSTLSRDAAFISVLKTIPSEIIKNDLLFENASGGMAYAEDLETYYKSFMDTSTDEEHKTKITESYNKLKKLAKGSPSPKFVNYENYAGGATSLDDLKGKYVYVDVWATWCGPCKAEIPFLKEVEEKYHGKNIEFVSISVDKAKDHEKWKKMIEEKELGGMQLFADNDWNSDFVKGYLIQGIPRFILIDTEGNIINPNAPRPSDPKLIDLFNEYSI